MMPVSSANGPGLQWIVWHDEPNRRYPSGINEAAPHWLWRMGIGFNGGAYTRTDGIFVSRKIIFPGLVPVFLTATLPAVWTLRLARYHRRKRLGLCLCCGYDLRASAERCSECGAIH